MKLLLIVLKREQKVELTQGKLQVAFKETLQSLSKLKVSTLSNQVVVVNMGTFGLTIEPLERGKGYEFENKVVGGTIPREYIPAVEKGLEEAKNTGVLGGYPVVDFKVMLNDGHTTMLTPLN